MALSADKVLGSEWVPNFKCPHCGKESDIYEMEYCPVVNSIETFTVVGSEGDENDNFAGACGVEIDWGPREVWEPDMSHIQYYCRSCHEIIDDEIDGPEELFNWLYQRGMVECQTVGISSS